MRADYVGKLWTVKGGGVWLENVDTEETQLNTRTCRHVFKSVFKARNVTIYGRRTCIWSLRYVTFSQEMLFFCQNTHQHYTQQRLHLSHRKCSDTPSHLLLNSVAQVVTTALVMTLREIKLNSL